MPNAAEIANLQQTRAVIAKQLDDNLNQYAQLMQARSQVGQHPELGYKNPNTLMKQAEAAGDTVKAAEYRAIWQADVAEVARINNEIDQNQANSAKLGGQLNTIDEQIQQAQGTPTTGQTLPARDNNVQDPPTVETPISKPSVPPNLYIVARPSVGVDSNGKAIPTTDYWVVDAERGVDVQVFDTREQANAYVTEQGATPGAAPPATTTSAPIAPTPPTIDDGSDPYVSNGATTIPVANSNTTVDDGSDPYVSNGQSTIPPAATATPPAGSTNATGVQKQTVRSAAVTSDASSSNQQKDWRVKLTLAKNANYLYKAPNPGILQPLKDSEGLVFPYTPAINVTYSAGYDMSDPVHSNYKIFQYKGSSVDNVQITCDFTAQDTNEAQYLLAVIHFLRSATKMFYGNDSNPKNGVPPPLVYLTGLGEFQFNNHPLLITNFTYSLPNDVDYIKAGSKTSNPGTSQPPTNGTNDTASTTRTAAAGLAPTAVNFSNQSANNSNATYVPTKMQLAITCIPVVSRNDISNRFSLREYATGALLRGNSNNAGGIW